jgi:hypothetical protein
MGGKQVIASIPLVGNIAGPVMIGQFQKQVVTLNDNIKDLENANNDNLSEIARSRGQVNQLLELIQHMNEESRIQTETLSRLTLQVKQAFDAKEEQIRVLEQLLAVQ